MSKFLSGRQSNFKLGVSGYTENKTVLETTGKVGIGTTDAQSYSLFVVGDTNITGLVSATSFYGDGSNLENTGATLSAAAGTQRLVVTSLTSGTMVDAATDSDLTFNATTNTLNTDNLIVAGNLTVSGDQTILNTTQLEVEDINIGIASASTKLNDAQLDGAGITIHGLNGDKTLIWDNSNSWMAFNTDLYAPNLQVGSAVTVYGNAGIVSAISFYGDGSNLTNTGATLSATSGVERLVTTQLTSGTMVDAATDADLTFDAGTNTLKTENIHINGGISTNGVTYGQSGQLLRSTGTGWEWRTVPGIFSVNNILNGFNVLEEGSTVGTAGSIHTLDFRGINVFASGDPQPNGIATITFSPSPTFTGVNLTGVSTITGTITAGSSEGINGQYLRHIGTGVTWASFPTLRVTQTNTATAGQTAFNFSYNVDFLDVFVNGVKLTSTEYTATNGNQIVLNTPAFADEIVEFHSYNITSNYGGGGGGGGGASNLDGLTDVSIGTLTDKDLLQYQSSSGEWENVSVNSLPYATEAFVGLSTAGLASEAFVGLSTVGLASEAFVGLSTVGLASETFVGLSTAGLASEALVGLATAGLLTAHQSLIGKANVTISDNPPGIGTASGDLWWESDTAKGHIYYDDGSSAQWVEFNPSSGGGGGGGGGSYGNADVDSHLNVSGASSGQILSWNGSDYAWVADQTGGGSGITTANINADTLTVNGDVNFDSATSGLGVFYDKSADAIKVLEDGSDKTKLIIGDDSTYTSYIEMYHDGGNSGIGYINYTGTQKLILSGSQVVLMNKARTEEMVQAVQDAGVYLYHNGSQKFETTAGGVTVTGTATATSFVKSGGTSSQYLMADGSVSTGSGGSGITTANINADTLNVSGISTFADTVKFVNGSNDVLSVTTDSSQNSVISQLGSGLFTIKSPNSNGMMIHADHASGQIYLRTGTGVGVVNRLSTTNTGVTVTGTLAATAVTGDGSGLTNLPSSDIVSVWTLGASGSSHYTFTGPGLTGAENDPTIYLVRGQTYRFTNNSGGSHPFQIRYNSNGTAYSDGVTNNGASSGNIDFNVQYDAPDVLYYQCTNHSGMLGKIIILGDVVNEGSWTASAGSAQTIDTITGVANNAIKTAEYTIHIENGSNMQAQKVLVMQDGTTAFSQEYAIMHKSGLLVSMSATISGGDLLLQATPETGVSGTTTYKVTRQTMR